MFDKHMGLFPRYKRGEFAEGPSFHHYDNKCFALTGDHLESLLKEMQHGVGLAQPDKPPLIDVRACTRTGEMRFQRLSEVVSYGNSAQERLQSIGISVQPEDKSMMAMVRFQDYFPGWSVSVIVEGGDEQASLGLFGKLRSGVESTYRWYSFLLSTRFWIGLVILVLIAYLASLVGPPLMRQLDMLPPAAEQTDALQAAGAATEAEAAGQDPAAKGTTRSLFEFGIISLLGLFFALVVLPYLFPRGIFLIGEEVKRAAVLSKLRWGLLAVVVVVPAAAVVMKLV
jgi:hypothetical protein